MTRNPYPSGLPTQPPEATSVHPQVTSSTLSNGSTYRSHCLRFHLPEAVHAIRAMELWDSPKAPRQLERMLHCREHAFFVQHEETLEIRVTADTCKVRWCPMCQQTRRSIAVPQISHWLTVGTAPKFLTLTLKHNHDPLAKQVAHLYDSFKRLRRTAFFKDRCRGGVWFFQVKQAAHDGTWHPHLHCLIDSDWLPHPELKRHWQYLTAGSHIIDIRPVRNPEKTADYVARYATCPCDLRGLNDSHKVEALNTFQHIRVCGTWGSARGISFRPAKTEDWFKWRYVVGFFAASIRQAADVLFRDLFQAWMTGTPLSVRLFQDTNPAPVDACLDQSGTHQYHQTWFDWSGSPPKDQPPE